MLTLPLAVWLKKQFPEVELYFLGNAYTEAVIACFEPIDRFLNWTEVLQIPTKQRSIFFQELEADCIIHVFPNKEVASLAKKARIPMRIGTSHRAFHLLTCNYRLNFTRKNSKYHEAQLNFELLKPFGIKELPTIEELLEMIRSFKVVPCELPADVSDHFKGEKKWVILHPKSQGSAVEWQVESYIELANSLLNKNYKVFFTGTASEGQLFRHLLPKKEAMIDLTGRLTLQQLIVLISKVEALVACSTGPLHIAAFSGIHAIGLYSPRVPIHPGRWKALGEKVSILVNDPNCAQCAKKKPCTCIREISVQRVLECILQAEQA
jgi:heptosyltransferase-3